VKDMSQNFGQIIKTLRTKSAANPALILAAICLGGGLAGASITSAPINYVFVGISVLGVFVAALQIMFFTIFDRDRLHDEEHVEKKLLINAMMPMFGDAENLIEIKPNEELTGNPQLEGRRDV